MISDKQLIRLSKFLSLVLRHKPETIGIRLDPNGWTDVGELIEKSNGHGILFDREILNYIVSTNSKKRFAFNETLDKIRASQGHSVEIELGYTNQKPPEILFHGTGEKSVPSIMATGLEKRNRQHVHLSSDFGTAVEVGKRHGKPYVFKVLAEQMYNDNFQFFISDNGVWLTDSVPTKYLKQDEV
ncbi:RNA 2'-phosphotransferase [Lewinella lacunae]|uniref:Probable RNA 2'-phosphotransferase n=2 Tax=Neolewinella lacunae TaxID=1517758 RepID=A0A923TDK2_9BACT|nr:RNA 2'-phosphotransferase [Neolewinella lacunae]MBC6994932.1 RNA 2'-phosphotransferase [Neolewinella lacunae]